MRISALSGVQPEIQAYAMAKYSRSRQSMLESIGELSAQRAEQFLNTFYFQYGHRSIADLAHVAFAVEDISILAAIELVDEPVWDGQERSTRYQDFKRTGYVTPGGLGESEAKLFDETARGLFQEYDELTAVLLEALVSSVPRPDTMDEAAHRRTLRARAFDITRGLLPLATTTSVGQIVSARVLERQISRLLGHTAAEVREMGEGLRAASRAIPAQSPEAADALAALHESARELDEGSPAEKAVQAAIKALTPAPAAPTLVKYTQPDTYEADTLAELRDHASLAAGARTNDHRTVALSEAESPIDELISTLLYAADPNARSYAELRKVVAALGSDERDAIVARSLEARGKHDELLREHRSGYSLIFDLLLDIGSYRDFHRHRRCVQIRQPWTGRNGWIPAEDTFKAGLGPAADRVPAEIRERYDRALLKATGASLSLGQTKPEAAPYLLPLAVRTRALFKMDLAEAVYISEQRTAPAGHFSYRAVAFAMYRALIDRYPVLADRFCVSDPATSFDLLER